MRNLHTRLAGAATLVLLMVVATSCNTAKVTDSKALATAPKGQPKAIYVADFDLQAQNIKEEEGVLGELPGPHGPVRNRLLGHAEDPQALAGDLVNWMSDAIVKELSKAGLEAMRLQPGAAAPADGWLVRGVFTEVQQGNRLRRAVIGLGQGKTDVQVITVMDNLADGPPKPFYQIDTSASSSKRPGGAATIVLSPIGIPIQFVLAGKDLKRNAQQTGTKIADEVARRVGEARQGRSSPSP
jgi:hypothetical protein